MDESDHGGHSIPVDATSARGWQRSGCQEEASTQGTERKQASLISVEVKGVSTVAEYVCTY